MITPGFMVLHGNRMEVLRDVLIHWLEQYPLRPLESETILVQSNGMAQWIKHAMADTNGLGITAAVEVSLPARFLWRMYRAVLADQEITDTSPLDKDSLVWRLLHRLPGLLEEPPFKPLRQYLATGDDPRRLFQLCQQVADVFDQYQVYRADWLEDWSQGHDRVGDLPLTLTDSQQQTLSWQAQLWRTLLEDIGTEAIASSRASVHPRVVSMLEQARQRPSALPRRVVVFGMSSLPAQTLEALSAMARFSQVILCVHNPCQFYWGDIVADKELLRHRVPRHRQREGMPAQLSEDALHQHAQPLLAAWGKQGRDYIALLEAHDDPASYADHFQTALSPSSIDLFTEPPHHSVLGQLQSDILNLRPLHESQEHWNHHDLQADVSLQFHITHGAQREVEVLHDQLLDRLEHDPSLHPRDIIVMVPDIDRYAPHIQAVFGQTAADRIPYMPYSIADQGQRGREPLLIALETLLHLPELRLTTTQVMELLDVPALRRRFDIEPDTLPLLERWMAGAGVRWGLDAKQRHELELPEGLGQNTWAFGLKRMLLGYAMGDTATFAGHYPYDEVAGLEAAALGNFVPLLNALEQAHDVLSMDYTPVQWGAIFHQILADFFAPDNPSDELLLLSLRQAIESWLQACSDAEFADPLALTISREAWLQGLASHHEGHGFMAGAVTFCTLMPMRAIPFKIVCLLGMNDGDYPRSVMALDFDLMDGHYRPGDRSRREDDRYLFLEALLAARDGVIISWVGRSQHDNSVQPPSVLVAQLRDHIERVYGVQPDGSSALDSMTTEHPLQPFSAQYFDGRSPKLFTYAMEWCAVHGLSSSSAQASGGAQRPDEVPQIRTEVSGWTLSLRDLQRFLRQPVVEFYEQQFKARLSAQQTIALDDEPFYLDNLQRYHLRKQLLSQAQRAGPDDFSTVIDEALARQGKAGQWPLPPFDKFHATGFQEELSEQLRVYFQALAGMTMADRALTVSVSNAAQAFQDVLPMHGFDEHGQAHHLRLYVGEISSRSSWTWHRILPFWVEHVLFHVAGQPVTTRLIGQDRDLIMSPLKSAAEAIKQLETWLELWQLGMTMPLPIEHNAAVKWLEQKQPDSRNDAEAQRQKALLNARKAYQYTGRHHRSALDKDPILKRDYPDFDTLISSRAKGRDFFDLATHLYGSLHAHDLKASTRKQASKKGAAS